MDSVFIEHLHSNLMRCLRREYGTEIVTEIKLFFDKVVSELKDLVYTNEKPNGLDILTTLCDDLVSIHILHFFNHPILINHPIFTYIGRTLEMLLIKCNHSKSIPMTKSEENCFYSISYLIAQLCLYYNAPIDSFYGSIANEIPPVTDKITQRDETINASSRRSNLIAEKPNLKVISLSPSAPKSRPIEETQYDVTTIAKLKKFPIRIDSSAIEKTSQPVTPLPKSTDLPSRTYREIFLTESFLNKLVRAINDLSENEYPPYHVKYKVIDRLVRVCSKLNITDVLFNPIVKCLRSKFYQQTIMAIETEQMTLTPQQLFFICECPQFIMQHEFQHQEQIPHLLCQTMINVTKLIIDKILPTNDEEEPEPEYYDEHGKGLYALRCHLELLNYFTLTPSGRRYFLQTNIIDQMMNILNHNVLIDNACANEELFNVDVSIISYIFMIFYNLAYEKTMFLILKRKDFEYIYSKLNSAKDITIKFVLKTLLAILSNVDISKENDPIKLKKSYIEYIEKTTIESKKANKSNVTINIRERDDNIKQAFLTDLYITTLVRDIQDLSKNAYSPNALKYKNVGRRVRVVTNQETNEVELLLDPILECLHSDFYLNVFEHLDLSQSKAVSGTRSSFRNLAAKHIFFLRECPEFIFRHDYKRRTEIAETLGEKILDDTKTIFEQHLSVLIGNEGRDALNETKAASMTALSYHIKILNHFALIQSIRREFLSLPIIDQILSILEDTSLIDPTERIADAKIGVVEQSLKLLYNLGMDDDILPMLKMKNVVNICLKLRSVKDNIISFMSQILLITLNEKEFSNIHEPNVLSKISIEYIDKSVREPRQLYQGIKLNCLLKTLEVIVRNDAFVESLAEEKGISVMTKCVCIKSSEDSNLKLIKKIQESAVFIIWRLSFSGPKTSKYLKSNDLFIDKMLVLLNGTSKKAKQNADAIIWRLGSEEQIRFEKTQKDTEKQRSRRQNQGDTADDDQLISPDEWDETIPYDLLISYSSNVNDKILALKVQTRLLSRNYRVYSEDQGSHRLELMQKAAAKKKPILVCLSSAYRKSNICMAEVECANKAACPIIPVIVEPKYKVQGWLKHSIGGKNSIDLTLKAFNEGLLKVFEEIEKIKSSD